MLLLIWMQVPETGEKQEHSYSEVLALSRFFFCLFVCHGKISYFFYRLLGNLRKMGMKLLMSLSIYKSSSDHLKKQQQKNINPKPQRARF